jgi:CubicO group peptidase (beta-lactamase class C family)
MLNIRHLEQSISTFMQADQVPGLALAIVQGQEVMYARGFGRTSVEGGSSPITPETLFGIGSTTKPLTGTAIMRLVERGDLDLDRAVKDYVPDLRFSDASAIDQVTLRMLLSHTAGLPTAYQPFGRRDPEALEAWVREELPLLPFVASPGKVHSYSNPGINLAGYIAQAISGKAYTELMSEEVFGPLAMQYTTLDPLVAMTYPIAQAHQCPDGKTLRVWHRFADNSAHRPSGYALSTVLDLANFAMMQMHDGSFQGKQILTPNSVRMMQEPQADLYMTTGAHYGLTLRSETYKGLRLVGHDGDVNSFLCRFVMVPEAKIAVIILVNWSTWLNRLSNAILDELLSLPKTVSEPEETIPEQRDQAGLTGWYLGQFGLAKILLKENRLTLELNGEVIPLKAYRTHGYVGFDEHEQSVAVGFVPPEQGPTHYLMVNGSCYTRVAEESLSPPDPSAWPTYTGVYTAIFETWVVRVHEGELLLKSETFGEEMPCRPLDRTRFTSPVGMIEFREVKEGKASILVQRNAYVFTRMKN